MVKKRNIFFMFDKKFHLVSFYSPTGDQPQAIEGLVNGVQKNHRYQLLLGATGTGKTFTMANIIQQAQKPTLVLAHNKTLAAQLCSEFQQFFPENAVSYFVSYYDYYQPEAYLPRTDTFIEKEATINEEIEKFRHAATVNLMTRRDVIIVSSVSCIYGLGDVEMYRSLGFSLLRGKDYPRTELLRSFVDIQYQRTRSDLKRGTFEVLGDVITVFTPNGDTAYQLEFWGDSLDKILEIDSFTGEIFQEHDEIFIFPAKHQVTTPERIEKAIIQIEKDLEIRLDELKKSGRNLEAHRLGQRTRYDMEMLREMGYVNGIENYTRYLTDKSVGSPPDTLLDYFPSDFLCFVDESHISIPQIGGMFYGNLSRKTSLVEYGFRLPSAYDNRPLTFSEFEKRVSQFIYTSATPGKYEYEHCDASLIFEQIIRPTGLLDPTIEVLPTQHQIDVLLEKIKQTIARGFRVLVTTVTKKSAEDLSEYFIEQGLKAKYLHSEIETFERIEILSHLRMGKLDIVVGINLLREGLDLPEVALICILDADKEGFLRSKDALLQVIGRAARNSEGHVIMFANRETAAMQAAILETNRRRSIQEAYNKKHNITPQTIIKSIVDISKDLGGGKVRNFDKLSQRESLEKMIQELNQEMDLATKNWDFERAAVLRDEIYILEERLRKKK